MRIIDIIIGQLHFSIARYKNYQGSLKGRGLTAGDLKLGIYGVTTPPEWKNGMIEPALSMVRWQIRTPALR